MALSYSYTFSPGTTASSAEVNANFSSVATYVNAFLTSSQVLSPDGGAVGAPSFSRVGDTNTGMYFSAADQIAWTLGGTKKLELTATGLAVTDALAVTGNTTLTGAITSNLIFTDATYDIGASGATRPRDLFLSRNAVVGGTLGVTGASSLASITGTTYGGTGTVAAFTGTATPAGGASGTAIFLGSANFGIYFGSGAPSVSAAKGSIYLRSDGSSPTTRIYCNTNGGTTWAAITTDA
jgi:hypothetical protein